MVRYLSMAIAAAASALMLCQPAIAQSGNAGEPVVPAPDPHGSTPELARLNAQIMNAPTNTELNLRYARLAEQAGFKRKALVAYERILVYDPSNVEAQEGLDRIRRKLQPNETRYTVELGGVYESNPLWSPTNHKPDGQLLAAASVKDERTVGEVRWRTQGTGFGLVHSEAQQLNYGYVGVMTGPVLNILPGLTAHPALGGGVSAFDQRYFYSEAAASVAFEGYPDGSQRAVWARTAYRDYNDFFPSDHGWYTDVTGRFVIPEIVGEKTALSVTPWVRWSDIRGRTLVTPAIVATPTPTIPLTDIQPGAYSEAGVRADFFKGLTDWLVAGPSVYVIERLYRQDFDTAGTNHRRDTIVSPGFIVVFPNALGQQNDIRMEYRYIRGRSNNDLASFVDNLASVVMVSRF
jgi:hypothetical protein